MATSKLVNVTPLHSLEEEKWQDIIDLVRRGNYAETACLAAGVKPSSYHYWMSKGRQDISDGRQDTIYAEFVFAIKEAEALAQTDAMYVIRQAAWGGAVLSETKTVKKDGSVVFTKTYARPEWTAAAWYLERKYPDSFGRRDRLDQRVREEAAKLAGKLGVGIEEFLAEAQRLHEERTSL